MNIILTAILLFLIISVFTISPACSDDDKIIFAEIDGNLFTALINSTIIMVNGNAIQTSEMLSDPEKIGQVFIFEEKNNGDDMDETLKFWIEIATILTVVGGFGYTIYKDRIQQSKQDTTIQKHDKLEFSKLLNNFENKWTNARLDWKNQDNNGDDEREKNNYNNCYAMCAKRLSILDSLAFLSKSDKIDKEMLEYFKVHFTEGMLYEKWINAVEPSEENAWPHFTEYVDDPTNDMTIAPIDFLPDEFQDAYKYKKNTIEEFKI